MQECFRKYPEIYGSELEDADAAEAEADEAAAAAAAPVAAVAPAETLEEERQQLREDGPAKSRHSDGSETDNLPGVKLVESSAQRVAEEVVEKKEN